MDLTLGLTVDLTVDLTVGHLPPFQVVYDIQALQNDQHRARGIGRYITDHVDALLAANAPIAALVLNPDLPAPPLPQRWLDAGADGRPLVRWNTPQLVRQLTGSGAKVLYHCGSPFEPVEPASGVVPPHVLRDCASLSVTVFDVIPFRFPELHQPDHRRASLFRRRAQFVRSCDTVLAISAFTEADAITALALDARRVVYQGTGGSSLFPILDASLRSTGTSIQTSLELLPRSSDALGIRGEFLLTVSGWGDDRKNPAATFAAYAALPQQLRDRFQLVVVCSLPDEGRAAWAQAIADLGIEASRVVFTGHVDDETLKLLYQRCALFVFSSRYEGFGLPVLEAARSGAPCITSNTTSLPEILECPASLFEPDDSSSLANLIERGLTDTEFRATLQTASATAARRHTWEAVAQRTIEAWTRAVASAPTIAPNAERDECRVAMVGPFPPSKSGIGTFNARVCDALSRRSDVRVDRFNEGDTSPTPTPTGANRPYRQYPARAFGTTMTPGGYDATLYTIGNGSYHRATLSAALRFPGIVWLHDAHLAGLYLTAEGLFLAGPEPGPAQLARARTSINRVVERWHGAAASLGDHTWWRTDAYDEHGMTFLEPLLERAQAFIVNTEAARGIIEHVATRAALAIPPIHVLPLPFPRTEPGDNETDPDLIVSLGWVDPLKCPATLIHALQHARSITGKPLRLTFVGELAPHLRAELDRVAIDHDVAEQVNFTGFVTDQQYNDWLHRAAVVVQLRSQTRGEASAALCDAIAAERPTITSIATASELPAGVVWQLAPDASPHIVGDAIATLVTDEPARAAFIEATRTHAASWTFDHLAERVADLARQHADARANVMPDAQRLHN